MIRHLLSGALLLAAAPVAAQPLEQVPPPTPTPGQTAPAPHTDVSPRLTFVERRGPELGLAEALHLAGRRNLEVRRAQEEIERADAMITKAWSAFLPHASIELQELVLNEGRSANIGVGEAIEVQPQATLTGTGTVALPLFHFDSFPALANARAGREAAELAVSEARRQVELAVARAYYGILSAHRFRELQVRARENAEEHLRNAEARLEAGVGLRLDVTRAALEVEQAQSAIIAAVAAEDDAYDALGLLMDRSEPFRVAEPGPTPAPGETLEQLLRRTLDRSDLRLAGAQREIARRNVTAAWAAFLPSLDFAFNVPYTEFVSPFGGGDHITWNLVFVLQVPIYDGGLRYGNLHEQRTLLREAELREESLRQNASLEVRKAYRSWHTSIAKVDTARRQVNLAQEAYELARAAYEAGASTNLEVVDAQRQHRDAEANLVVASYDSQVALASLLLSAGRPLR